MRRSELGKELYLSSDAELTHIREAPTAAGIIDGQCEFRDPEYGIPIQMEDESNSFQWIEDISYSL